MVKARITEQGFELIGHAPKPPGATANTLCAAISVLAQTARDAMMEVAGMDVRAKIGNGYLSAEWDEPPSPASEAILEAFLTGLRHLAASFPGAIEIQTE